MTPFVRARSKAGEDSSLSSFPNLSSLSAPSPTT
jgi:hypothetical protein